MPALPESSGLWLRRTLGWSSSRESWKERLGVAGLAVFAVLLLALGRGLSLSVQAVLWGVLLLTAAALLRRGWLRLFGPVLFYDLVCVSRRTRYFVIRWLYALFLFALLAYVYWMWWLNTESRGIRASDLPEFAQ